MNKSQYRKSSNDNISNLEYQEYSTTLHTPHKALKICLLLLSFIILTNIFLKSSLYDKGKQEINREVKIITENVKPLFADTQKLESKLDSLPEKLGYYMSASVSTFDAKLNTIPEKLDKISKQLEKLDKQENTQIENEYRSDDQCKSLSRRRQDIRITNEDGDSFNGRPDKKLDTFMATQKPDPRPLKELKTPRHIFFIHFNEHFTVK